MKSARLVPLLTLLAIVAQGCAFLGPTKPKINNTGNIKIGLVASFSGTNPTGDTLEHAVDLARDEINKVGLLGGRQVEIVHADTRSDPNFAAQAADDVITQGAVALIGPNASGDAQQVVTKTCVPKGVLMISPNASSPDFSDPSKIDTKGYFFRTVPSDALQGKVVAKKATALGYKKLVVMHVDQTYGNGLAGVLEKNFTGTTVDIKYPYIASNTDQASFDYGSLVKQALDATPDAVVLVGFAGDASYIINDWITDGRLPTLKWIFTDATDRQDFVDNVKDKSRMEGQIGTAPYADPAFLTKLNAAFPTDPGVHGATAYDAMALLALAIAKSGQANSASIRQVLRDVAGPDGETLGPDDIVKGINDVAAGKQVSYVGYSGPFNFDEHGDMPSGKYSIWTVKNGKVTTTDETLTP